MRFRMMCIAAGVIACLLPFLMGQGCQPPVDNGDNGSGGSDVGTNDLTSLEKQAIVACCNAPGAVAQATDISQNTTGDLGSESSQQNLPQEGTIDQAELGDGDATFGTCPEVSKSGSLLDSELDLSIDFGQEPCTALSVELDGEDFTYICSGSASGTFSLTNQSIDLTFANISCNDQALDGTASLAYSLLVPGVELEGDWNLTWYPGSDAISTAGSGTVSYVPVNNGCCDVTSISQFTGNITEGDYTWSAAMTNILVSLEQYYSFIPYSGSMTVDGPEIRALTITFNENSPVTGEVTIAVGNSPSFTVSLYELDEWAAMMLGE